MERATRFAVLSVATFAAIWLAAAIAVHRLPAAAAPSETVSVAVELASGLVLLIGALVLILLPVRSGRLRRRWVGSGFLVVGLGQLGLGVASPLSNADADANASLYAELSLWGIAGICFVLGLVGREPPLPSARTLLPLLATSAVVIYLLVGFSSDLPELVRTSASLATGAPVQLSSTSGTPWYWLLTLGAAAMSATSAVAATVRCPGIAPQGWLAASLSLLAGSQLHDALRPSADVSVLTGASVLRLACSLLVVVGAMLELRRIAAEHEHAVDSEREHAHRLSELTALRADFTSIINHEIGSPLAAIRAYADLLDQSHVDPSMRREALSTIRDLVDHVRTLAEDVATIATIEDDRFSVRPFALPLNVILADGAAFAASLPGDHPFRCTVRSHERVMVDPVRIAQVLRNLLSNAAKYSPSGTPIELRAERVRDRVRIEVADRGYGVPPDDLDRIFEKFGRSRAAYSQAVAGSGLGLYISRRIVEAHGSRLTVSSTPGVGSVFGFEVEVAA